MRGDFFDSYSIIQEVWDFIGVCFWNSYAVIAVGCGLFKKFVLGGVHMVCAYAAGTALPEL
jgi:hypothetical protein